jgi:cellulose synthase/poly-beta-1,6-N-acetylglucosamine synthase-like glycosyltransferase
MNSTAEAVRMIFQIILWITLPAGLYQIIISLFSFGKAHPPNSKTEWQHHFAILVCARDEENVLGNLIESLNHQQYPREMYDIFVVADNCEDHTADVARQYSTIVYERFDPSLQTKGYAMNWFFKKFRQDYPDIYDACVVFDADNVADPGFLAAMNRQLCAGKQIAVGYRLGKNPNDTWISGTSTIFWLTQSRFFFLPRFRLGLPCCSVGGTGFMFRLDVLGVNGWETQSLCEDIEFALQNIEKGNTISYAYDAVFYDEQPESLNQSIKQRYRWAVGTIQVLKLNLPGLLRAVIKEHRWKAMDGVMFALGLPFTAIAAIASTILFFLPPAVSINNPKFWFNLALTATASYVFLLALGILTLLLEHYKFSGMFKSIFTYPIYIFISLLINIVVLFYRKNKWYKIPHIRSMNLTDTERERSAHN